jgi:hypothetical protein
LISPGSEDALLHATTYSARQVDGYAIELSRVSKRFGASVALDEVGLTVRRPKL